MQKKTPISSELSIISDGSIDIDTLKLLRMSCVIMQMNYYEMLTFYHLSGLENYYSLRGRKKTQM